MDVTFCSCNSPKGGHRFFSGLGWFFWSAARGLPSWKPHGTLCLKRENSRDSSKFYQEFPSVFVMLWKGISFHLIPISVVSQATVVGVANAEKEESNENNENNQTMEAKVHSGLDETKSVYIASDRFVVADAATSKLGKTPFFGKQL